MVISERRGVGDATKWPFQQAEGNGCILQVFEPYGVKERIRMTNKNGVSPGRGRKKQPERAKAWAAAVIPILEEV
jgi:hypothetical protein